MLLLLLLLQIGEIVHTSLPSRSALLIRQKFQWTSEQLKSTCLDLQYFHRRSSKFPAEHLSLLLEWFTLPVIASIWVSSFHLSVNIVMLYRFTVPVWSRISKTSHIKLKREVSRTEKRFKIVNMFSGRRQRSREERNRFVNADVVK